MNESIETAMTACLKALRDNSVIQRYHRAKEAVNADETIQKLEETIETQQKQVVQFNYYEKKQAVQKTNHDIDALYHQLDYNEKVQEYRDALSEANDLLHYVTHRLETAMNKEDDDE